MGSRRRPLYGRGGREGIPKGWSLEKRPSQESKVSIEQDKEGNFLHLLSVNDAFGLDEKDFLRHPQISVSNLEVEGYPPTQGRGYPEEGDG